MAKPKAGENSKKAQGQARKAEAAASKQRQADEAAEAAEAAQWDEGSKKGNKKQADQAAKREEAARKKAERDAELAAEEAMLDSKPKASKNKGRDKILAKKSGGSGIDSALASSQPGLSAHGIDDAIAALELTTGKNSDKIDRHPERRFKAALKDYEDRNLDRLREEHPGLRLNQMKEILYKEFQKAPENPFNQVNADYNASQADLKEIRHNVRKAKEDVLRER